MKILTVDLETYPMLSYHWTRWKPTIGLPQTVQEGYLASWAARWYGSNEIMYDGLNRYNMAMEDEAMVAASLWKLFDEADVLLHFNGDSFDIKVATTAFAKYGYGPPAPYRSIDLFKQIKKNFKLSSNSLKSACKFFGVEQKQDNSGWKLWIDCVNKDPDAWLLMEEYNKQDIVATEALYKHIQAFIKGHPNHAQYKAGNDICCTNCGSSRVWQPSGSVYLKSGKYQRYKCRDCGTNMRGPTMINTKTKRNTFMVGV